MCCPFCMLWTRTRRGVYQIWEFWHVWKRTLPPRHIERPVISMTYFISNRTQTLPHCSVHLQVSLPWQSNFVTLPLSIWSRVVLGTTFSYRQSFRKISVTALLKKRVLRQDTTKFPRLYTQFYFFSWTVHIINTFWSYVTDSYTKHLNLYVNGCSLNLLL